MDTAVPLERPEVGEELERAALIVRALTYLVAIGVFAGLFWAYWEGYYRRLPFPRNTFLFDPGFHFRDLTDLYGALARHDPYSAPAAVDPPFGYLVAQPFAWLGGNAAVVLWVVLVAGGLGSYLAWMLGFVPCIDRAAAVVVLTVFSFPFLYAFDRGNLEVVVTLLLAAFVWGLQTDHPDLAAIAVGAAAAMKAYPLIFAALFLVERQWRRLAIVAVTGLVLSFLGTVYYRFDALHVIDALRRNVHSHTTNYVIHDGGLAQGCSLWGGLKIAVFHLGGTTGTVRHLLPLYVALSCVLALGVVAALWRLPLRFWEQVALLTIALVALPTVSGDYKLLHLVVPAALFLRYGARDRWSWWYLAGFAALMVPKAYVLMMPGETNIGVLVDPLILLMLGLAIVAAGLARLGEPIPATRSSSHPQPA